MFKIVEKVSSKVKQTLGFGYENKRNVSNTQSTIDISSANVNVNESSIKFTKLLIKPGNIRKDLKAFSMDLSKLYLKKNYIDRAQRKRLFEEAEGFFNMQMHKIK